MPRTFSRCLIFVGAMSAVSASADTPAYPFELTTDAPVADARHNKILFEDVRVRLIEVTLMPGETEAVHGNAYPSVTGYDAALPQTEHAVLDQSASRRDLIGGIAAPPPGGFPYCRTQGPEAPYATTNKGDFPLHYYRIEFKRQDWPELGTKWKQWYPWMAAPEKPAKELNPRADLGPPFSAKFPFALAYDSVSAAPNNHYLRYHDDHVRFVEVIIRPGETELMHGHPYPSVFARDGVPMGSPPPPAPPGNLATRHDDGGNEQLVPGAKGRAPISGWTYAAEGFAGPNCTAMDPEPPHRVHNGSAIPDHFYRLEYVRLDGNVIKSDWQKLYGHGNSK